MPPTMTIATMITVLLSNIGAPQAVVIVGIFMTVIVLLLVMVVGAARPLAYQRRLARVGIFRSARPNDMVVAGLGRTFQNIRLFPSQRRRRELHIADDLAGPIEEVEPATVGALGETPGAEELFGEESGPGAPGHDR